MMIIKLYRHISEKTFLRSNINSNIINEFDLISKHSRQQFFFNISIPSMYKHIFLSIFLNILLIDHWKIYEANFIR